MPRRIIIASSGDESESEGNKSTSAEEIVVDADASDVEVIENKENLQETKRNGKPKKGLKATGLVIIDSPPKLINQVKRKRLRMGKKVVAENSSFQLTKRSKGENSFKSFSYKEGSQRKSGRLRRSKREVNSGDELSELSDHSSSEESEVDDDAFYESEDDEVELLFSKCEAISKRLQKRVMSLKNNIGDNQDKENGCISQKQGSRLFPDGLILKGYQLVGLNWLHILYQERVNGILADEMGLGKTIQTMSLLALLKARYGIKGLHLVVAPGSTLENWRREISKWLPDFKVVVYHGSQIERDDLRRKIRRNMADYHIILTTYTYFERESNGDDRAFFYNRNFEYVIYDEAHAIKNLNSQRYKRLIGLNCKRRLLLSGTPVQNNLNELLALMSFTMPKVFVANSTQLADFFKTERQDKDIKRLRSALKPFILRRIKKDVMSQLGDKIEKIIELPLEEETQKRLYSAALEDFSKIRLKNLTGSEAENVFVYLRKVCNHPLLVKNYFGRTVDGVDRSMTKLVRMFDDVGAFGASASKAMIEKEIAEYSDWKLHLLCLEFNHFGPFAEMALPVEALWASSKCQKLKELILDLKQNGHRVVLFSQWTTLLDILEEVLNHINVKFVRFDGQTAISERQQLVDDFNTNEDITVFLLSTRAGGLGINLTSADTVIIHDLDFNPTVDQQATDRVHRIGQTKAVTVYKLVSKDTVDHHILRMQQRKLELDDKLFDKKVANGSGKTKTSSKQDMKSILQNLHFT